MYFVGIDISKYKHDCCIITDTGHVISTPFTIKNNLPPQWKDTQQRTQQFADVVRLTLGGGMVMGEVTSYLSDASAVLQAQTQFSQQAGQRLSALLQARADGYLIDL